MLYLLPDITDKPTARNIIDAGLAHLLDPGEGFRGDWRGVQRGPEGCRGMLFGSCYGPERTSYKPAEQTWRKVPHSTAWVGLWNDQHPTPAMLQRAKVIDGHEVEMANGSRWLVPVARGFDFSGDEPAARVALPTLLDLDDDGEWILGDVLPQFSRLCKIAETVWDTIAAAGEGAPVVISGSDEFEMVAEVLSTNYRVSKIECVMLRLLEAGGATTTNVLQAVVDWPSMVAWSQKKSRPRDAERAAAPVQPVAPRTVAEVPADDDRPVLAAV